MVLHFQSSGSSAPGTFFSRVKGENGVAIEYTGPWPKSVPTLYVEFEGHPQSPYYFKNTLYLVWEIPFSNKVIAALNEGLYHSGLLRTFELRLNQLTFVSDVTFKIVSSVHYEKVGDKYKGSLRLFAIANNQLPNNNIIYSFRKQVYSVYKEFRDCLYHQKEMLTPRQVTQINMRDYV